MDLEFYRVERGNRQKHRYTGWKVDNSFIVKYRYYTESKVRGQG